MTTNPPPSTPPPPAQPGLTIKVYRVNPETMERTVVSARAVAPSDGPMMSSQYPLCNCPRCRTQRGG